MPAALDAPEPGRDAEGTRLGQLWPRCRFTSATMTPTFLFELLLRAPEGPRPVAELVRFVHVDAIAIRLATLAKIVSHNWQFLEPREACQRGQLTLFPWPTVSR